MKGMKRATVDGLELAYELQGAGEPVVLIHWGVGVAWAEPLLRSPRSPTATACSITTAPASAAAAGSTAPITIADHAGHCQALMRRLGIERAHVVGHSSSAVIALQLALDFPSAVQTLVLMEAARPTPQTAVQSAFVLETVEPAVQRYRAGDKAGAVGHVLPGRLRAGLPASARQGAAGRVRASSRRRGCVLHPGAAGSPAVVVHAGRRRPHHPARAGRPRGAFGSHLPRAAGAAALLAPERRALRRPCRDAPASSPRTQGRSPRAWQRSSRELPR